MKKNSLLVVVLLLLLIGCTRSAAHLSGLKLSPSLIPVNLPLQSLRTLFVSALLQEPPTSSTEISTLAILPVKQKTVDLYGLLELGLQTNLAVSNSYNPNELELRVSFSAPSGKEMDAGSFWYQDFDPATQKPTGKPYWKVRFTPDEVGEWLAVANAPALGLHSSPVSFTVKPSTRPGFIRVNPNDPHYLAFDNGDFFFPIGVNMAWWDNDEDPLGRYHAWLDQFTANGGNTIRVWMASWSFGLEWRDTGLGNYDERQYEAWLLDGLFQLAEEHRVKIILVLINHGAFSLGANSEWKNNPYNARSGGPLTSPEQFATDPLSKDYFRQKLNYLINRWGYSPELLAWEWFNEANLTPMSDADLAPWLKEMTAFLDEHDVNQHLTTTSFAMRTQSAIWQLPGLDIVQAHEYSSQTNVSEHDLGDRAAQDYQALAASVPAKPILLGEFGYSAVNYGDDIEKTGIHLHNGIWATTFSGYAGSGMYWWWDIYIDANHLWGQFKGLANFLRGEDLTQYQPIAALQISDGMGNSAQAIGLGLQGEKTLVWLRSNAYTVQAYLEARKNQQGSATYQPPWIEDQYLTLQGKTDGKYVVSWFDPQKDTWLDSQVITSQNKTLLIPVPAFKSDIAAKIVQIP